MARKLADPRPGDKLPYGQGSFDLDPERPGQVIRRHTHEGKRYVERGTSWAEVEAKRIARTSRLDEHEGYVEGSLGDLCERWLADKRRRDGEAMARGTEMNHLYAIALVTEYLGADTPALALDRKRVDRFLVDLANREPRPLTGRTINNVRKTLAAICAFGADHRMVKGDPMLRVSVPKAAGKPKERLWLTLDEYAKVRRYLVDNPSTLHTGYLVMLHCGLRPGEALGLRWDALDLDAGRLHVASQLRLARNGGRAFSTTLKTDSHGNAAHRTIPMTAELVAALRAERRAQFAGGHLGEYVFAAFGYGTFAAAATTISQAAGVRRMDPKAYRHTFASMCRHKHVPYEMLAKLMGHKTTRQIIDTYGHPLDDPAALNMTGIMADVPTARAAES